MLVQTFADLIRAENISCSGLDAALDQACPISIALCCRQDSTISRMELRDAIIESLSEALNVGLKEAFIQRWLPRQRDAGPWPASLMLTTAARLDDMQSGLPEIKLRLVAEVQLDQLGGQIAVTPDQKTIHLGEARAWHAIWHLFISDCAGGKHPAQFAAGEADVFLTPNSFPLP